jgi:HEAT repeat protein
MTLLLCMFAAAIVSAEIGDPCVAVMNGELSSRDACIALEIGKLGDRAIAIGAVEMLSGLAPDSIKPLRHALKTGKTAIVKANAADALGRIGPRPLGIGEAVPDLIAALKDEDALVRRQAAGALGRLGSRAKSALPALESLRQDADLGVRHLATFGIERINQSIKEESK